MISHEIFENCVMRAALAPTVHNTQPARWVRDGDVLSLFCDTNVGLTVGDPTGRDAALSCGAVLEAMVLALSAHGIAACATLTDKDTSPGQGLVVVAHLTLSRGPKDGLHAQLERRFTWRGLFASQPAQLYGWTRADTRLIVDLTSRDWLSERNDWASFEIMQSAGFRRELVSWMRLNDRHPRAGLDGMDRASMSLSRGEARAVPFVLIKLWRFLNVFGFTKNLTAEYEVTLTAPIIALFHCDITENTVVFGRAYLRMCLEAASLGFAGWPMAALSDHPTTTRQVCDRFGTAPDRRLVQVIRFGIPTGDAPRRSRRPLTEVLRKSTS
jgi:nitroreductase